MTECGSCYQWPTVTGASYEDFFELTDESLHIY